MQNKFVKLYLPALAYMAAIFTLSSFHRVPLPYIDRLSVDKIYHIIEYGILGFLLMRLLTLEKFKIKTGGKILIVFAIGTVYGITDEIHQYFVPGRYFSYWDIAVDSIGSSLGAVLYYRWGIKLEQFFRSIKLGSTE